MSLLDNGPHTVDVYPQEEFIDSRGNVGHRPSTTPIRVRCRMTPILGSPSRESADDLHHFERFRFSARTAPLGPWARIVWGERKFTVESGPAEHDKSAATRRVVATLIGER